MTTERRDELFATLATAEADVSGLELERAIRRVAALAKAREHLVEVVPLVTSAGLPTVRKSVEGALRAVSRQLGRAVLKANRLRAQLSTGAGG